MRFKPWIGPKYSTDGLFGIRVLALGESHYADDNLNRDTFTSDIVRECVYQGRFAFFTKVAKLLRGMDAKSRIPNDVLHDTWDRIAFYNYIQQPLSGPRIRPTNEMWNEAGRIFPDVLRKLEPQIIVVLGKGLSSNFTAPPLIETCFTEHPSSPSFKYEPWLTLIQSAYRRASARPA